MLDKSILVIDRIEIHKDTIIYKLMLTGIAFILGLKCLYFNDIRETMLYHSMFMVLSHISIIDYQERIIPDKYFIILIAISLLNCIYTHDFAYLIEGLLLSLLFYVVITIGENITTRFFNKDEIIGAGDCKLLFSLFMLLGSFKSYKLLFCFIILITIKDIILKPLLKKDTKENVAFGPYIQIGVILVSIVYI